MLIYEILKNLKTNKTGIWFMRQAGRYLPEYREIKQKSETFLDMCYDDQKITEITLQPIRRFDIDAAIIFSDILVLHDLIGFDVNFIKNEGPILSFNAKDFFCIETSNIDFSQQKIQSIYKGIKNTRSELNQKKALIGFVGAPWTLACYAIEKQSSKDFKKTKLFSYEKQKEFAHLIDIFTFLCVEHLSNQIKAGANVVQIFDSWSNVLDEEDYFKWVFLPFLRVSHEIRLKHQDIPIIWFPRASMANYALYLKNNYKNFLQNFDCLGVDYSTPISLIDEILPRNIAIQGNLEPISLACDDFEITKSKALKILNDLNDRPRIFNLGHGMIPESKIDNIHSLIELIRNFDNQRYGV